MTTERKTFEEELTDLINRHSRENESDTPDFILARYMEKSLHAFTDATRWREQWYGRSPRMPEYTAAFSNTRLVKGVEGIVNDIRDGKFDYLKEKSAEPGSGWGEKPTGVRDIGGEQG
jgi:hypothetical protein